MRFKIRMPTSESETVTQVQARADATVDRLLPNGPPAQPPSRQEFFELYKMMVDSSEALVARRQGVNTFFLTINGLVLTVLSLFVKSSGDVPIKAGAIAILAFAGALLCWAWRSLLISFGQLNTGKFAVINEMESHLAAAVYAAEWIALGEGKDKTLYRSFTKREAWVPGLLIVAYLFTVVVASSLWLRLWDLGTG